jgi:MFS family permease
MAGANASISLPWYRTLSKPQWNALIGSNLGWVFDGYETYALILVVGAALHQLLDASEYARIPAYAGMIVALTLLGWAIGGLLGGIIADYFGRKRTMIFAILGYSLLTGLSALAWDWTSLAAMRFLVGLAIGSEWVTGTSIVAEFFPDGARGRGVGYFQVGFGIGFFLAAFIFLFVGGIGPNAWRWMFVIGVLPALLTLWVRRNIPESALWERSDRQRQEALGRKRAGAADAKDETMIRFTLSDLFVDRELRRRTILASLMALASTFSYWGISTWVPLYAGSLAQKAGLSAPLWISYIGMAYNFGAIIGYVALGYIADWIGRKPTTMIYMGMSLILTPVVFFWTSDLPTMLVTAAILAIFVSGQFTWMSAWLPELYPTRMRATGAGFVFNAPRLIAWIGPLVSGFLVVSFGGFGRAATIMALFYLVGIIAAPFLPETKGRPLPEAI